MIRVSSLGLTLVALTGTGCTLIADIDRRDIKDLDPGPSGVIMDAGDAGGSMGGQEPAPRDDAGPDKPDDGSREAGSSAEAGAPPQEAGVQAEAGARPPTEAGSVSEAGSAEAGPPDEAGPAEPGVPDEAGPTEPGVPDEAGPATQLDAASPPQPAEEAGPPAADATAPDPG